MTPILLFLAGTFASEAQPSSRALQTVQQIRTLSRERAKAGQPVHLRGTVMVLSGWKDSFFFQDRHLGISVDRRDTYPELHSGDTIEMEGVTGEGMFAPVVNSDKIKITGHASLPVAPVLSMHDLENGRQDSQWIALRGVVRSAVLKHLWDRDFLVVTLATRGGELITLRVLNFPLITPPVLIGATVRVSGVCGSIFNTRRQFAGPRLFVDSLANIKIEHKPPADPFGGVATPLAELLRFRSNDTAGTRVIVAGTVTYVDNDGGFYMQEGSQGVSVKADQQTPISPGMSLSVVGYPQAGSYSPKLVNASYRPISERITALPLTVDPKDFITSADGFLYAPFDALLVRTQGKLLQIVPGTAEDLLLLEHRGTVFSAKLPASAGHNAASLRLGSLLEVTGVCSAVTDESHEARSVELLLRSAADITVLHMASRWTAGNLLWVVAALLLLLFLMFGWIAFLRRQARLHALITLDSLTGLYNRRGFLLLAEQRWQFAIRQRRQMLLFFIDLDRFKQINDTFGHQLGDEALETIAGVLKSTFRKSDVVGRLGGDEFAIVAENAPDWSEAIVRDRLHRALKEANTLPERRFALALSMGVLQCDQPMYDLSIEELLSKADTLMYEHKKTHHALMMQQAIST